MVKKRTRTRALVDAQHDLQAESIRSSPALLPYFQRRIEELSRPDASPQVSNGEVVPVDNHIIEDRLQNPDTVAVDASLERTDLLQRAGCLETGLDTAATIGARNSLEKMLAHQLAACHSAAMRLVAEAGGVSRLNPDTEQVALKKVTVAARLMDVYREGFVAIMKNRRAGGQRIRVEHVTINGGQAVIAGAIGGGCHGEVDNEK